MTIIPEELFATIHADFIDSQDFIDFAHHFYRDDVDFRCHHNSYLVAGFLQRRGHAYLQWTSGYYQCRDSALRIHHSWIKLVYNGKIAAIFEFDPMQLYERGGYDNDPMPSGNIPEFAMTTTGTASIIDPDMVDLPENEKDSRWVVSSKEVLSRYVEHDFCTPDIDFELLDAVGLDMQEEFDRFRKLCKLNDGKVEDNLPK